MNYFEVHPLLTSLGNYWTHNHNYRLTLAADNVTLRVLRPDGRTLHFKPGTGAFWISDNNINDKVEKLADGWRYVQPDGTVELYNTAGLLQSRTFASGIRYDYGYDANSRLSSVADAFGHHLGLAYNDQGQISELTDPAGQRISYTYDDLGNLQKVTWPDTKVRQYGYTMSIPRDGAKSGLLTDLTDENGVKFAHWAYNDRALAISSEHAGGVDKFSFKYTLDANGKVTAVDITTPLNAIKKYQFISPAGINEIQSETHPLDVTKARTNTYDANGNLSQFTDFNGSKTVYSYDLTRNLPTKRVEASGTALARTFTTQWHASLALPLKEAGPLLITSYGYDAQGNLLSRSEQATTDANGSKGFAATVSGTARTWTYTWNSFGQLLTEDGPRTDVSDVTSYAYDAQGNLLSVTDAAGLVTQYGDYDAHGRAQKITAPNGKVTLLSYHPRGWLLKRDDAGLITEFAYDGVGQLKQIRRADGKVLDYQYDDAHRLMKVSDNHGNQIRYQRDNAGNVLLEEHSDSSGQLASLRLQLEPAQQLLSAAPNMPTGRSCSAL
ncbi:RHS repeat protein [Leeia sp. IMCC25680]|uniref:RHS repeat protein n=1 Tax=Leeia aquatica TaxID=2725557 RepID=A0A847SIP1_9NEIS|nr:RHS repeat protein [Leeia aquatica]